MRCFNILQQSSLRAPPWSWHLLGTTITNHHHLSISIRYSHSHSQKEEEEPPPTYERLVSLAQELKHYTMFDRRIARAADNTRVFDKEIVRKMTTFRDGAQRLITHRLRLDPVAWSVRSRMPMRFLDPADRKPMEMNSLKTITEYLSLKNLERKKLRFNVINQITTHSLWYNTVWSLVADLDADLRAITKPGQVVKDTLRLTSQVMDALEVYQVHNNWKEVPRPETSRSASPILGQGMNWSQILVIFKDIYATLRRAKALDSYSRRFLVIMRDGMGRLGDVRVGGIADPDVIECTDDVIKRTFQEYMGYSSNCLFTLLNFYLFRSIRNVFVDMRGRLYLEEGRFDSAVIYMGEIVTCSDARGLFKAAKHLHRAMKMVQFVYTSSLVAAKPLTFEGHIWAFGVRECVVRYREAEFFIHALDCPEEKFTNIEQRQLSSEWSPTV